MIFWCYVFLVIILMGNADVLSLLFLVGVWCATFVFCYRAWCHSISSETIFLVDLKVSAKT